LRGVTGDHTVRLTPKSLFFTIVAAGLPFAVTIGWALGDTTLATPPAAVTPDGFGGIGTAPEREKPVKRVGHPERTPGPRTASTTAPVIVPPRVAEPSVVPSVAASPVPEPSASLPTPTPSESTPPPSASAHPSVEPSVSDEPRVHRHP
jgi:hypothetical protein